MLCLILYAVAPLAARKSTSASRINTGDAQLDSLILRLNRRSEWLQNEGIGTLDCYVKIRGSSYCENTRWWTPLAHELLPFNYHANDTFQLAATCKVAYQTPCDLLITPLTMTATHRRRSRRILKELNQVMFPFYSMKIMRDKGDDKNYVLPFSHDGLRQYNFQATDTVISDNDTIVTIHFCPKRAHHELMEGDVVFDLQTLMTREIRFKGRIDFGWVTDTTRFDTSEGFSMPVSSSVNLDYKYGKMLGHNHFDYEIEMRQLLPRKAFDPKFESLDLSAVYHSDPAVFVSSDTLANKKDSIMANDPSVRRRQFIQKLPQRMVSTTNFTALGTDVRINGPLNPAGIGYDHVNGITLRQPLRFSHLFANGQSLNLAPEVGYSCRLKELRYRFMTEWTYCPERRASLMLRLRNGSNGFSSRYRAAVNRRIRQYSAQLAEDGELARSTGLSFDSLGLQFFHNYEFMLENAIELVPGLMFHFGTTYSIRRPVKHGAHAQAQLVADATIEKRYLDMNPYLRLVWTPRQYYYYEGRQKLYLKSQWPTFSFEVAKGVKNILKSRANYCRLELDAQQIIPIGQTRNLSWHFGAGGFFKQRDEYFVNYTYFSRSQYPSTWDRRASGGAFALLDDYWYSSSASYVQQHVMFECPFLLLHRWKWISKYIIKERVYGSLLWARSKSLYEELGYGIGNNYFNVSLFYGFIGVRPFDVGLKFSIEIDQHL